MHAAGCTSLEQAISSQCVPGRAIGPRTTTELKLGVAWRSVPAGACWVQCLHSPASRRTPHGKEGQGEESPGQSGQTTAVHGRGLPPFVLAGSRSPQSVWHVCVCVPTRGRHDDDDTLAPTCCDGPFFATATATTAQHTHTAKQRKRTCVCSIHRTSRPGRNLVAHCAQNSHPKHQSHPPLQCTAALHSTAPARWRTGKTASC